MPQNPNVVITNGSKPLHWLIDGFFGKINALEPTSVVDTTGAGDSFAGGVVGYIANHGLNNPVKAVIQGTAIASYTVSGFGLEKLCKISKDDLDKKINQISFK